MYLRTCVLEQVHACTCTCITAVTATHIRTYVHTCIYTYISMYTYCNIHICTVYLFIHHCVKCYVRMFTCPHAQVCASLDLCTHICTYVCAALELNLIYLVALTGVHPSHNPPVFKPAPPPGEREPDSAYSTLANDSPIIRE